MIRGECLDIPKEELNCLYYMEGHPPKYVDKDTLNRVYRPISYEESWEKYSGHDYFRLQCLKAGFELTSLYPVYHQGWEMDEWGAIGFKDGKRYRLETCHGSLKPKEEEETTLKRHLFNCVKELFR